MSSIKTMHEAFLHELSDTYNAEHQLTDAMSEMLGLAQHPKVKQGLQQHIKDTQQQIKNLDQVFKALGTKPEDVTCKGAKGIIDEFKSGAKEIKQPDLLNGFIVAGGMKGEHYEIATYRCLVAKAELMGHTEALQLLQQNLEMEEKFSQQLEGLDRQLGEELIAKGPELVGHEVSQFKPAQGARSGTSSGR